MAREENHYLANFCGAEALLKLILMVLFMAIVFAVLTIHELDDIITRIGLTSLFMLFIAMSSVATLCLANTYHWLKSNQVVTWLSLLLFSFYTAVFTFWVYEQSWFVAVFKLKEFDFWFVLFKFEVVNLICIATGLRYLYLQHQHQRQLMIKNQSRLAALQARIRPHFLFNSMNTIASLVHDAPDQAEQATVNLSHLFRASLSEVSLISLQQEIELTKNYLQIEQLRLGERLKVEWDCEGYNDDVKIPPLTLQPLLENAIYHGIEPSLKGGVVTISSQQHNGILHIIITNPVEDDKEIKAGNQMALKNIQERLHITFKGKAHFSYQHTQNKFEVSISIPIQLRGE